jgi:hypothetical protein
MTSAFEKRYSDQIPWVSCQNMTGVDIPPFSCVMGQQWNMPDASGSDASSQFPNIQIYLPSAPVNPEQMYLTGTMTIPAGSYGQCARPVEYPMLASINSLYSSTGPPEPGETCGPIPGTLNPQTLYLDAPGFILLALSSNNQYVFVRSYTGLYRGFLPSGVGNTMGLIPVQTAREPDGTPSNVVYPVCNPYGNIITAPGINLRCTYGWVGGQWELVAADPCADQFGSCTFQSVYGRPPGSGR